MDQEKHITSFMIYSKACAQKKTVKSYEKCGLARIFHTFSEWHRRADLTEIFTKIGPKLVRPGAPPPYPQTKTGLWRSYPEEKTGAGRVRRATI